MAAARRGDFHAARTAADRAVAAAPRYPDARFVRAGILAHLAVRVFAASRPPRRGVDYRAAARLYAAAEADLLTYLKLRPNADDRAQIAAAIRALDARAAKATSYAQLVRSWDHHRYRIEGRITCGGTSTKARFEIDGAAAAVVGPGTHRLRVVTRDCHPLETTISPPRYDGGPDRVVDVDAALGLSWRGQLRRGGPAATPFSFAITGGFEAARVENGFSLDNGTSSGVTFAGGATGLGPLLEAWLPTSHFGHIALESGAFVAYHTGTAHGSTAAGNVDVHDIQAGLELRLRKPLALASLYGAAGGFADTWSEASGSDLSPHTAFRLSLTGGLEVNLSCAVRGEAWVRYAPELASGSHGFSVVDAGIGVALARCRSVHNPTHLHASIDERE